MRTRTKVIIAVSAVLAVLIAVAVGVFMYIKASPEWALKEIVSDIKSDGIEGLKAHSTEAFCKKIEKIENYAKEKGIGTSSGDDGQDTKSRLQYLKDDAKNISPRNFFPRSKTSTGVSRMSGMAERARMWS